MFDNFILDEIRKKADIVEIINSYITLEKKGKNYFGVCPFHDDHSPSMSVSPTLQIFNCFTCKSGGNVFNFVSSYENISFNDAVIKVANIINYPLNIKQTTIQNPTQVKNQTAYQIYDIANKFYVNNLFTKHGVEAVDYLQKRNFSLDTIKEFDIGLSSIITPVNNFLFAKNYTKEQLIEYGIISESGYDVFSNRIMIPIHNSTGQVIAWTGRIYNNSETNRYLNSKETVIFKKGDVLFNFHRAIKPIKQNDYIIIVEGNMDVIRLFDSGIKNCIALMGTNLSNEQIHLIKRVTNNVILCLDNDNAGKIATETISNILNSKQFNVKIINMSNEKDPDEYIIKNGKDSFINMINNSINYIDYKLELLKNKRNFTNIEEISFYLKDVILELNNSNDELLKEMKLNQISKDYNISISTLQNMMTKKEIIKKPIQVNTKNESKYEKASKRVIKMMTISEEAIFIVKNQLSYFENIKYKILSEELLYYYKKNGIIEIADLCNLINDKKDISSLFFNILSEYENYKYNKDELLDYINLLNNKLIMNEKTLLKQQLEKELDPIKKAILVNKILGLGENI